MNEKERQTLWIDADIHQKLKILAAQNGEKLNDLVDKMAGDFLKKIDKNSYKSAKNNPPPL